MMNSDRWLKKAENELRSLSSPGIYGYDEYMSWHQDKGGGNSDYEYLFFVVLELVGVEKHFFANWACRANIINTQTRFGLTSLYLCQNVYLIKDIPKPILVRATSLICELLQKTCVLVHTY